MEKLEWRTEKRKVKDLKLYEGNPRKMSKRDAEELLKSLSKFNLVEIPVVDQNNRVIAGNQRVQALKKLGRENEEIEVRVPSRPLTEEEAKEYLIRSNKVKGEWDWDILRSYGEDFLKQSGWYENEIKSLFLEPVVALQNENLKTPVYEPMGVPVRIRDLYDDEKAQEFLKEIEALNCDPELKKFLRYGAYRHIEYHYRWIAEFYCQLKDEKIKDLFKRMALVIIDGEDAIKLGYLRLMKKLVEMRKNEG